MVPHVVKQERKVFRFFHPNGFSFISFGFMVIPDASFFQLVQQEELMTKLRDEISSLQTDLTKSTDQVSGPGFYYRQENIQDQFTRLCNHDHLYLVKYFHHWKINFVSSSQHVIFSICFRTGALS